jgi:hypothetical protein
MQRAYFEGGPPDLEPPGVTVEAVAVVLAVETPNALLAGAKTLVLAVDHARDGGAPAY